jgi:hypothetical protein
LWRLDTNQTKIYFNSIYYSLIKQDHESIFVITSHSELGNTGRNTGFWVEEFAAPYYSLADKGVAT